MAVTSVPDRGDNPSRRIKYSDMGVTKNPHNGAYNIYHSDDAGNYYHQQYYGYTKREAMKKHKERYSSGEPTVQKHGYSKDGKYL
jgi:hypothetical protein